MSNLTIQNERVDDVILILTMLVEMGIVDIIDGLVPRHGNRQGLSVGELVATWLAYILSTSDHRLSYVEVWSQGRLVTLSNFWGVQVTEQDFTDDRLGDVLVVLSDDELWSAIESSLNKHAIRVYSLPIEVVRIDTTSVVMYHDSEESILAAFGHSKDHRPDLPQIKVALLTLDPLAMPLVTTVVPGNTADDGLYLPLVEQARESLLNKGPLLHVGDTKMEATVTRGEIDKSGDYYLMPLSQKGAQKELLIEQTKKVLATNAEGGEPKLLDIYQDEPDEQGKQKLVARTMELSREQVATLDGEEHSWQERLILTYSPLLADKQIKGLDRRLHNGTEALQELTPEPRRGKKQYTDLESLEKAVAQLLKRHRVEPFLEVSYALEVTERHIRPYKDLPARTETTLRYIVTVTPQEEAIAEAKQLVGWRFYATNAPQGRLSMVDVLQVYRAGIPTIERDFSRLKGKPLGLRPFFVRRDDHLKGLIRLLSLALRFLTLVEYIVRRSLEEGKAGIAGLYPGNPKQTTKRPTCERLLHAFDNINLTIVTVDGVKQYHMTPLSEVQKRILQLLGLDESIYARLAMNESNSI